MKCQLGFTIREIIVVSRLQTALEYVVTVVIKIHNVEGRNVVIRRVKTKVEFEMQKTS